MIFYILGIVILIIVCVVGGFWLGVSACNRRQGDVEFIKTDLGLMAICKASRVVVERKKSGHTCPDCETKMNECGARFEDGEEVESSFQCPKCHAIKDFKV